MQVDLMVLNYNGRKLLEECLPSVVAAASRSRHACQVTVVDNGSADDSLPWLRAHFPHVGILHYANDGLCSFNRALEQSTAQVAVLLNNDIQLAKDCLDPWIEPLAVPTESLGEALPPRCFLSAPLCWQRDGKTLEGFKTAVRWRWGLVQATGRFEGAEAVCLQPSETASAGAAIAVDRHLFLELGGFDPRYLPGRIEDLDFCYRGHLAGYYAAYIPQAVAWHHGAASFGPAFGEVGNLRLALRNTLLFQWRHLRHPANAARQVGGISCRVVGDVLRSPLVEKERRFLFCKSLVDAIRRGRELTKNPDLAASPARPETNLARESEFFRRFHPAVLAEHDVDELPAIDSQAAEVAPALNEYLRDERHPCSRWYLLPLLNRVVPTLAKTSLRPSHFTEGGLVLTALAGLMLMAGYTWLAAACVWLAWVCDRVDGKLARGQRTASRWGAWLDANTDELCDLGMHVAVAAAASVAAWRQLLQQPAWLLTPGDLWYVVLPWLLLSGFLLGKYLLFYGQWSAASEGLASEPGREATGRANVSLSRRLYHLPGNADVRLHVLVVALASGWLVTELVLVAAYFNIRWMVGAIRTRRRMLGGKLPARLPAKTRAATVAHGALGGSKRLRSAAGGWR